MSLRETNRTSIITRGWDKPHCLNKSEDSGIRECVMNWHTRCLPTERDVRIGRSLHFTTPNTKSQSVLPTVVLRGSDLNQNVLDRRIQIPNPGAAVETKKNPSSLKGHREDYHRLKTKHSDSLNLGISKGKLISV